MSSTPTPGPTGARSGLTGTARVLHGFREFIARGNAIELAVGVVIGAAFGLVVSSVIDGFVSPLIAAIFGQPDLSGVANFTINHAHFSIGLILNALLQFLLTAAAVYGVVVLPLNALQARRTTSEAAAPAAPAEDVLLLQEIRDLLAARPSVAAVDDTGTTPPLG